jgi:hypothetical protein
MLTEMTFESVTSEVQLAAAAPKEEPSRGRFGGLGSRLGRALGGADDASEPRSTIFESTTELLDIDGNPDTSLVAIPADFTEES